MKIGDIATMNGCTVTTGPQKQYVAMTFKAPKGQRYVFLLLGTEPNDETSPLDCEKRMNELGWYKEGTAPKKVKSK